MVTVIFGFVRFVHVPSKGVQVSSCNTAVEFVFELMGPDDNIGESDVCESMVGRVEDQIEGEILNYIELYSIGNNTFGPIAYDFFISYDFTRVVTSIDGAIISGDFSGSFSIDTDGNIT